jgi:hypothetical protein
MKHIAIHMKTPGYYMKVFTVFVYKVPPKRRFLQEPHDVTSQKTPFLMHSVSSKILTSRVLVYFFMFIISFYLQSVLVQSTNCVKPYTTVA